MRINCFSVKPQQKCNIYNLNLNKLSKFLIYQKNAQEAYMLLLVSMNTYIPSLCEGFNISTTKNQAFNIYRLFSI